MRIHLSIFTLLGTFLLAAQDVPNTSQAVLVASPATPTAATDVSGLVTEIPRIEMEETQERPPDARPGLCYAKLVNNDETTHWKTIPCEWKEWDSLEMIKDELEPNITNYGEHYLNKRLKPLIRRGLSLEIQTYYNASTSDVTDNCLAFIRAQVVGEYLVQAGLPRTHYKITVLPKAAKDTFFMNYRVINRVPKKGFSQ